MESKIRAGVIGTGFIGPVHVEALKRNGIEVTAICGSENARPVAEKWGIPEVYTGYDYRAMLASEAVDVVHITSPNRHHHEQALAVLAAGKHCICEKPLAMTSAETGAIVERAKSSGTVFAVNYNVRFYPAMLHLRGLIADGVLGDIVHVNGSYMQDWLLWPTDYNWRLLKDEGGSLRAVGDIGTHWMDLVCFVLGTEVTSVLAGLGRLHDTRKRPKGQVQTFAGAGDTSDWESYAVDTEDYASILLRFGNGAVGNLGVSQVAAGRKNSIRVEVYGSKQSAWWESESPNVLVFGNRGRTNEVYLRDPGMIHQSATGLTDYPGGHNEGFPDTFKMLYRNVYAAIRSGGKAEALYATAEDGHRELLVCEAIERSHLEQRWIEV